MNASYNRRPMVWCCKASSVDRLIGISGGKSLWSVSHHPPTAVSSETLNPVLHLHMDRRPAVSGYRRSMLLGRIWLQRWLFISSCSRMRATALVLWEAKDGCKSSSSSVGGNCRSTAAVKWTGRPCEVLGPPGCCTGSGGSTCRPCCSRRCQQPRCGLSGGAALLVALSGTAADCFLEALTSTVCVAWMLPGASTSMTSIFDERCLGGSDWMRPWQAVIAAGCCPFLGVLDAPRMPTLSEVHCEKTEGLPAFATVAGY